MDLILVACSLLTQLTVQAHLLAIGRYSFAGDIASPCFSAEQHAGNGHRIESIRLGSKPLTLMKLMRLSRMEQAELLATLLQGVIEVFNVACRRLHPDEDLLRQGIQVVEFVQQDIPSIFAIGKDQRFAHQAFVWSRDATCTRLTSDINPADILDRGFLF
jgi:hypothetical protein